MKRDRALVALSHDHHQALFQAQRMRRATPEDLDSVRHAALAFWMEDGSKHFRIEEEVLLPAFATVHDPADEAVARVLVDHVWIRAQMTALAEERLDLDEVHALGECLDAHVRHEERVLFPMIERALDPDALAILGRQIAAAEEA